MENYDAFILSLTSVSRFKELKDAIIGNKFTGKQDLTNYIHSLFEDKKSAVIHTKIKRTVTKVDDSIELVMEPYMVAKTNKPRITRYNCIIIFSIRQSVKDGRIWYHTPIAAYASKSLLTLSSTTKFKFPIKVD